MNNCALSLLDTNVFNLMSSGLGMSLSSLHDIDTRSESDVPVFTAQREPVAFIPQLPKKTPISADGEHILLSFATNGDGSAGRNFVFHNKPFYINTDRIAIKVIDDKIDIQYLYAMLHDMKKKYGFNHAYKANRHNLSVVQVLVPVDGNGKFDVLQQQEIAEAYLTTEQVKTEIYTLRQLLSNVNVVVESDEYPISYFPLPMLFDTGKGFAKYTKNMGTCIQANTQSTRLPVKSR